MLSTSTSARAFPLVFTTSQPTTDGCVEGWIMTPPRLLLSRGAAGGSRCARESGCHRPSYREHQDSHWLNDQCRTGRKRVPDRHQSLGCGTRCRSHKASQIPWRLELHDIAKSIECHWIHKIGKVILRQCLTPRSEESALRAKSALERPGEEPGLSHVACLCPPLRTCLS